MENGLPSETEPTPTQEDSTAPEKGQRFNLGPVKELLWNLGLISLGSVLCAVGVNGILVPHKFVSGGITGVALGIHYLLSFLPVSGLYFLLNIPLFAMGWTLVGRRFFGYSIMGMVIFSLALAGIQVTLPVNDKILSAILAGIIIGAGSGIILRSRGSAGGTDILSVILLNRFSIRVGNTVLAFNSIVLAAALLLFSLDAALYTLVYLYVSSHIINLVLTGLSQRKVVLIISVKWEEISREILNRIHRGVTFIQGRGGYSGQDEQILYTVVTFRELPQVKRIIRQIDPGAFVVVHDTLEVMGHRIGNQPHW